MDFITKGRVGGDWLIAMNDGPEFCFEQKVIDNSEGTDELVLASGYPMDDAVPVAAADIANTDGLLLEKVRVPAGETRKVAVLARGGCVINRDALPTVDKVGASINMTTFGTTITALGFVVRREPTKQTTQTT